MSETPKQEYIRLLMDLDGSDMAEVAWNQQKTIMKQSKKMRKQRKQLTQYEELEAALRVILDAVDYMSGNCRLNEMVGAVLPKELIAKGRDALSELDSEGRE